MPIIRCIEKGQPGYKFGTEGKCFIGPGSRSKAAAQGRAIKASQARVDQISPVDLVRGMRSMNKASGVRLPSITKQPARQASGKTLERQYFREILKILDPYYVDVRERLIPKLPAIVEQFRSETRVDAVKLDTYGETITRSIGDIKIGIALQVTDSIVGGSASSRAINISEFNKGQFTRQFASVLGVNPLLNEPYLQAQIDAFTERNVALIKNIPDQSLNRIETLIRTQVEQGQTTDFIRKSVQGEIDISKNRAKLIARDQVNKFNGKLTELRQTEAGVNDYIWSTARDERVRPSHASKEGKKFSWDKPPNDTGHPGTDINCFPGNSLVVPTAPINRLYRRFYSGELTEIITEKGGRAVCTPNHPIFTSTGWKAMKDVEVGDDIANVNFESPDIFYSNAQNRQSKFVELFDSFSLMFGVKSTTSIKGDFHGDTIIDQTIDIIDVNGGLMNTIKPGHFKEFNQEIFAGTINNALLGIEGFGVCGFNLTCFRSFAASSGIIRLARNLLFLRFGAFTKSDKVRFTPIAYSYFVALKAIRKRFPLTFEFLGEFEDRKAIDVLFDKNILIKLLRIMCFSVMTNKLMSENFHSGTESVGMNIKPSSDLAKILPSDISGYSRVDKVGSEFYSGHVYNLQTFNNWYGSTTTTGEQLIYSNCRCVAMPILEDFKPASNINTTSRLGIPLVGVSLAVEAISESLASVEL